MNKSLFHLFFTCFLLLQNLNSFAGDCVAAIENKLGAGDAVGVAHYFDENIYLNLPDSHSSYSQAQAKMILNDFFKKNHPNQIAIDRTGNAGKSKFAIGTLKTTKGTYRVYILFKQSNANDCLIKELRIE